MFKQPILTFIATISFFLVIDFTTRQYRDHSDLILAGIWIGISIIAIEHKIKEYLK